MGDAYKCDKCAKFHEGKPAEHPLRTQVREAISLSSSITVFEGEFCKPCADRIAERVQEVMFDE